MRSNKNPDERNAKGAAQGVGEANDYLYVIAGGQFYRLSPVEVKQHPLDLKSPRNQPIIAALKAMQSVNSPVADLQAPGPVSASCACIALNIDVFDGELHTLPAKVKP
jgi:hypothetical protein